MTNNRKMYVFVGGVILLLTGVFIGKSFSEKIVDTNFIQSNVPSTTVSDRKTLTEIIRTYNAFSVGEERKFKSLKQEDVDLSVDIGLVDEVRYVFETNKKISYKFYRVGEGDVPPQYSTGRIIVWVQAVGSPSVQGGLFDTEITDVEPFGKIEVNSSGGITINCSSESAIKVTTCGYTIMFDVENIELTVKKIK